ncbi:MAG: sialate O-acetylesterase [Planctomycetota bacterium]|nr:sialate O-acetylesterase [Planctomycetota bacterium]
MNTSRSSNSVGNAILITRLLCFILLLCPGLLRGEEPLKIFLLAGQSNMVGHARGHTIATLFHSDKPRDRELLKMVFDSESGIDVKMLEEQLARGQKLDHLTGGISNDKIKAMPEGAEKTALEERVKELKEQHESYKSDVIAGCRVSDRVYIHSIADRNRKSGKLGVGYGADAKKIGPEYGFGLSMATKMGGPILLIKTSWGGKSLNYNFRPPSAGEYELNEKEKSGGKAEEIRKNVGLNYRMMNESIREVLDNLKEYHPAYDEKAGYQISGFVWFQGFNDQFSPAFRDNYKSNMIHFIKDIRREYKVPKMPFVIGVLGTPVTEEKVSQNAVSVGQRQAAQAPEFRGNVVAVESYTEYSHYSNAVFKKGWPKHYHEWDTVGSDRPYHYLGSGAFFVRLGDAFADAMAELMAQEKN